MSPRPGRVLVVDDDEDVLLLCRLALEARGFEVVTAATGPEAVEAVAQGAPSLVLLDVMLPGYDGFVALEAMPPEVPVVLVSARVGLEDRRRGLEAGAVDYVTKPFSPDELGRLVARLTGLDAEGLRSHRGQALAAVTGGVVPAGAGGAPDDGAGPPLRREGWIPLEQILDLAVDAIVSIDAGQRIVGFNRGAEELFGYVAEEVLGKPLEMLLPDWAADVHRDHVGGFAAGTEAARVMGERREIFGRRRDGSEFPAEASIAKVRAGDRQLLTAILRDATERRVVESELRAHARRQAVVAEIGQRALGGLTLDELTDEVAGSLVDVLGGDFAEVRRLSTDGQALRLVAGRGWGAGVVGSADVPSDPSTHAGFTLHTQEAVVLEDLACETRFAGGDALHEHGVVSGIAVPIPGAVRPFGTVGVWSRTPRRFGPEDVAFVRSLANVVAAAAHRDRTEKQLRTLLEAAPDATLVVDERGQIVSANAQAESLFGYDRQRLVGMLVDRLVPGSVRDAHAARRSGYSREPRTRPMGAGLELQALRADGTEVPVDIMLSPLRTDEGLLVIAAVRDASERRRADAVRDSFLHAVSHELRTPLTSVVGFAGLLAGEEPVPAGQERDLAGRLLANALKLERLLSDLLDLDRLSRGVVEPRRRPTDVGALARSVVATLSLESHEVEVDAEPDPFVASVDPGHIERTVENLLANVARHTPPGTRAWVRLRRSPNGILLSVEDDGAGVPADLKDEVFQPFRQGSASAHAPGTGIGLSLVARFAELHGGRAWVEDRPGGGAAFRVLLAD